MVHTFLLGLVLAISSPKDMIVPIESNGPAGNYIGTGFLIDKTHLMSAAHVLNDNGNIFSLTCKNKKIIIDNKKIFVDHIRDLAIVKIDEFCKDEVIKFAKHDPEFTEPIWAIGCPENLGFCGMITSGIVSLYRNHDGRLELISDINIWYGNSGGPVIIANRELVGILVEIKTFIKIKRDASQKITDIDDQNYAIIIPISEIKSFVKKYTDIIGK